MAHARESLRLVDGQRQLRDAQQQILGARDGLQRDGAQRLQVLQLGAAAEPGLPTQCQHQHDGHQRRQRHFQADGSVADPVHGSPLRGLPFSGRRPQR
jgi:hypothetical protein